LDDVPIAGLVDARRTSVVGDLVIGLDGVDGVHRDRVLDAGHTEAVAVAADDDLIGTPLTSTMLSLHVMVWLLLMPATLRLPPAGGKGPDGGEVVGPAPGV
jgi:hypothetical protein